MFVPLFRSWYWRTCNDWFFPAWDAGHCRHRFTRLVGMDSVEIFMHFSTESSRLLRTDVLSLKLIHIKLKYYRWFHQYINNIYLFNKFQGTGCRYKFTGTGTHWYRYCRHPFRSLTCNANSQLHSPASSPTTSPLVAGNGQLRYRRAVPGISVVTPTAGRMQSTVATNT